MRMADTAVSGPLVKPNKLFEIYFISFYRTRLHDSFYISDTVISGQLHKIMVDLGFLKYFLKVKEKLLRHRHPSLYFVALLMLFVAVQQQEVNIAVTSTMGPQISGISIVCSTIVAGADQRKRLRSASPAFVWGIHAENVPIWWHHHEHESSKKSTSNHNKHCKTEPMGYTYTITMRYRPISKHSKPMYLVR